MKIQDITAKERQRFEFWASSQGYEIARNGDEYKYTLVQQLWEAWFAAVRLDRKVRHHVVPESKLRNLVAAYDDWTGTLDPADRISYLRQMNSIRDLL